MDYTKYLTKKSSDLYGLKYLPSLHPHFDDHADCIEEFMESKRLQIKQEFSDYDKNILLKHLNKIKNYAKCILEIGVNRNPYHQSSTEVILNNKNKETIYIGIDIKDKSFLNDPENNIHTIKSSSSNHHLVYKLMDKYNVHEIDFILIDGLHSVNQVLEDWKYVKRLSQNGIIMMHDISVHPGPNTVFNAIDANLFFKIKYEKKDDWGVGIIQHKNQSKYKKSISQPTYEITNEHPQNIQPKNLINQSKYRVAIVLAGLSRSFRRTYKSLYDNLINKYPRIKFDIYISTWNITGNVNEDDRDQEASLDKNYINKEILSEDDIVKLNELYHPIKLEVEDYVEREQHILDYYECFKKRYDYDCEQLRIFNGLFAQYYKINKSFQLIDDPDSYNLIIRTRLDLEIKCKTLDWDKLFRLRKDRLIAMEEWDPLGIKDLLILGSPSAMKIYMSMYDYLTEFTDEEFNKMMLSTVEIMTIDIHFGGKYEESKLIEAYHGQIDNLVKKLKDPEEDFYILKYALIPERVLRYYLTKHNIVVVINDMFELEIIR